MNDPKISVLIPMYNRKHYIQDCINSVLNQTFQDFEIIVRDDGSKDGSAEFVEKIYSKEISEGKIKLFRNEQNRGEFITTNRLIADACGKYITILHSDDAYLPHALKHLHEVAEKTNADVVHSSYFFNSEKDGSLLKLHPTCWENHPAEKVKLVSDNPELRFSEWVDDGTFCDLMYNIFNRKFILNSADFFHLGHNFLSLWWIMQSKVFVKTPIICYIRRDAPDSLTNSKKISNNLLVRRIENAIKLLKNMDELFLKIDFLKDNEDAQFRAKAHMTRCFDEFLIKRLNFYKDGITPKLHRDVAEVFKKYFGDEYFYPAFLFHWVHVMQFNKSVDKFASPPSGIQ